MIAHLTPVDPKAEFVQDARIFDLTAWNAGIKLAINPSFNRHKFWFTWRGGATQVFRSAIRFSLGGTTLFELPYQFGGNGLTLRVARMAAASGSETSIPMDYTEGLHLRPPSAFTVGGPMIMHMFSGHIDQAEIISSAGTTFVGSIAAGFAVFSDNHL